MSSKKQASLSSFFGVAGPTKTAGKENQKRESPSKPEEKDWVAKRARKQDKHVIDDTDSEDEGPNPAKDNKMEVDTKVEPKKEASKPPKQDKVADSKPASAPTSKQDTKPAATKTTKTNETSKPKVKAVKKDLSPTPLYKAATKQFDSNEKLLEQADWQDALPYATLCQTFTKIEDITGRLEIQAILTKLLRQVLLQSPADLRSALYLCANAVAPPADNVELGVGDSLLIKAISQATGSSKVKAHYERLGDLGTVAQTCKSQQRTLSFTKPVPVTVSQVHNTLRQIAYTKGHASQQQKVGLMQQLLVSAVDPAETKYAVRALQGKLRIGLAQSTVLISLAHALALTGAGVPETEMEEDAPEEVQQYMDAKLAVEKRLEAAVAIVKKAYSEVPSYDALVQAAFEVPLQSFHMACTLKPGIPIAPMLAKPTKSIQEVLQRLNGQRFTCEYKYDGERAQVHLLPDGTTKVFSRNMLDTSEKYPEVPGFVSAAVKENKVQSYVMDAEVVAFDGEKLVPFQVLSTRKKTETGDAKVKIIVQAFDLMFLNGESLLAKTLAERRALLHEHFEEVEGKFRFATALDHTEDGDTTILEEFLDKAVKGQCEGLMVKTLDSNALYEPSRRSLNWLKLKKDYLEGLGDSVDLVPLGAYHGKGKRTGVYGAYLLACYDADTEDFQSVCKIGTGFSDEDLQTLAKSLNEHIIPAKSSQYNTSDALECDVWFDAVQVWEVKAADLSKSSAHRGAVGKAGEAGRGIGLRFPRFERVRDDKKPVEATTSDQILDMYYSQDTVADGGRAGGDDDDDGI